MALASDYKLSLIMNPTLLIMMMVMVMVMAMMTKMTLRVRVGSAGLSSTTGLLGRCCC